MLHSNRDKKKKKEDFSAFSGMYSNIILTGLTACGKTEIGAFLAGYLGWGFVDTDELVQKMTNKSPENLILSKGIAHFRACEWKALNTISFLKNHVISLGGGTFCDKRNQLKLRQLGLVVWIDVFPKIIARRLSVSSSELEKRPLLRGENHGKGLPSCKEIHETLESLYRKRSFFYKQAHLIVRDNYSSSEIYARKVYHSILGA